MSLARVVAIMVLLGLVWLQTGCQINNIQSARRAARIASVGSKPIVTLKKQKTIQPVGPIRRLLASRATPSERTLLQMRKNNWSQRYLTDPALTVEELSKDCQCNPNMENVHAIAELAQLEADWNLRNNMTNTAAQFYATAVIHAYQFLFDPQLNIQRNAYDPQFREICDIYNRSLESLLRLVCGSEDFRPGENHFIGDENFGVEFQVEVVGRWKDEQFEKFELANDFKVNGIDNSYHTYGLGVPLVAVRKPGSHSPFEQYYPPSLALPLTAFWEVQTFDKLADERNLKAVIKLYDPLERTVIQSETRNAPLESDFTVPLAYYLNDPLLNNDVLSTVSLLNANIADEYFGFYMLEPFDEKKIPVVMVHGLWSNPVTWMKMFNDLRANQWIRDHYQFWFYMYPTGQPFWFSADQMRGDLAKLRRDVDPHNQSKAMDEMVLVGHSMGGLISRMQVIDSGDDFWQIISDEPIANVKGDPLTIEQIRDLYYFQADQSIKKIVTIGAPHRGSTHANNATRWLSHQLFRLPKKWTANFDNFVKENEGVLRNTKQLMVPTSIDSLSPQSPYIQKLLQAQVKPEVDLHNVYGNAPAYKLVESIRTGPAGDGVVSVESAQLPGALSSKEIPAEHMEIHQHPECILEVKRILVENLINMKRLSEEQMRMAVHLLHEQTDHKQR